MSDPLSPRMWQIIELVGGRGMTYDEVADALAISKHTVDAHVSEIARRIGGSLKPRDAMVRCWLTRNETKEAV